MKEVHALGRGACRERPRDPSWTPCSWRTFEMVMKTESRSGLGHGQRWSAEAAGLTRADRTAAAGGGP